MTLRLKEIEPFNVFPVEDHLAAAFMRHLTGNEMFDFIGNIKPKCYMIYELKYNYPKHCYAHARLLSISIDDLERIVSNSGSNFYDASEKHLLGGLHIEFGGTLTSTKVYASKESI